MVKRIFLTLLLVAGLPLWAMCSLAGIVWSIARECFQVGVKYSEDEVKAK